MSADRHRGIRREKQKRAKQQKRQARDQQAAAESVRRRYRCIDRALRGFGFFRFGWAHAAQLPFRPCASGKNRSFHEPAFGLIVPTFCMNSATFSVLTAR